MVPGASPFGPRPRFPAVEQLDHGLTAALATLGGELRENAWELALAVIDEALADDTIPSLTRLGRISQFGDMPTFITELSREVEAPLPGRMRVGGPLAAVARDHARQREALGFAPREVVTEFLLLRRALRPRADPGLPRSRRLQADQRHLRPRGGRPRPEPHRVARIDVAARLRHGGAPRRRRVRRPPPRGRQA